MVPCDKQKFIPGSVLCIYLESSFFWHGGYDWAIAPSWMLHYIDFFGSEIRAEFSFWTRLWLWAAKLDGNPAPSTSAVWPGACQTLNSQGSFSLQSLNVAKQGFFWSLCDCSCTISWLKQRIKVSGWNWTLPLQMENLLSARAFVLKFGSGVLKPLLPLPMWEFPLKMWNVYCIPRARHYAERRLTTPTISKPHVACVDFLVLNSHGNTNTCGVFVAFLGNHGAQPCKIILPTVGSTVWGGRYCFCVPSCWSFMPRSWVIHPQCLAFQEGKSQF